MIVYRKIIWVRRRQLLLMLVAIAVLSGYAWHLSRPGVSSEPWLEHFRRNRNLQHYLDSINLLKEPWSTPCDDVGAVPLVVLVSSAPSHYEQRDAIRSTWASDFLTYFITGITGQEGEMAAIYLEASQNNDLIVYGFQDHYQNLTLKTALMLKWIQGRCPQAGFMMKTDDDVLVNPYVLQKVLKEHINVTLLGYKFQNISPIRDPYKKWYLPSWLYQYDSVPQYLSGSAYFIRGDIIERILHAAMDVPLINIEDIYFTYLVASANLGLPLINDRRICPYRFPLFLSCAYSYHATVHGLNPREMITLWPRIEEAKDLSDSFSFCSFISKYLLPIIT